MCIVEGSVWFVWAYNSSGHHHSGLIVLDMKHNMAVDERWSVGWVEGCPSVPPERQERNS